MVTERSIPLASMYWPFFDQRGLSWKLTPKTIAAMEETSLRKLQRARPEEQHGRQTFKLS